MSQENAEAGLRLAVKDVVTRLVAAVPQAMPLLVAINVANAKAPGSLVLTLVIREKTPVFSVTVPRAALDSGVGRLAILRAFRDPLVSVAAAWAYGFKDGESSASQTEKKVEKPA